MNESPSKLMLIVLLLFAGCVQPSARSEWFRLLVGPPTDRSAYLGYPEDQAKPRSLEGDVVVPLMSVVKDMGYKEYRELKRKNDVCHEEHRGDYIYFAVLRHDTIWIPNRNYGSGAQGYSLDRYKTKVSRIRILK